MEFKIRKGTKKDLEAIWELEKESRIYHKKINLGPKKLTDYGVDGLDRSKWINSMKKWFNMRGRFTLVVENEEEEIVAYLSWKVIKWTFSLKKSFDFIRIGDLMVSKKHRRRGIAKILIREMEKFARERNIDILYLDTLPTNLPAKKLYHKLGYEDYALQMAKRLK